MSLGRLFADFLAKYDFWLTPTLGEPPPKLGVLYPPPDHPAPNAAATIARNFDFRPLHAPGERNRVAGHVRPLALE